MITQQRCAGSGQAKHSLTQQVGTARKGALLDDLVPEILFWDMLTASRMELGDRSRVKYAPAGKYSRWKICST